jgi:hypothetical protein
MYMNIQTHQSVVDVACHELVENRNIFNHNKYSARKLYLQSRR